MKAITFGVHFLIRNNRMDKKGLTPIYSKININGQVLRIAINYKIQPQDLDSENEIPKQTCKNFKSINIRNNNNNNERKKWGLLRKRLIFFD